MNAIAMMQGRLSEPRSDRAQTFPWADWRAEFDRAGELGLDGIEWLLEAEHQERNPLLSSAGRSSIRACMASTGVSVLSVCAHYCILHPFFRVRDEERQQSINTLCRSICGAADIGAATVLVPALESSEIRSDEEREIFVSSLAHPLSLAAAADLRIGLETELCGKAYLNLIERADHPNVGVYYDVGNCTAAGHDVPGDLRLLAPYLVGVHIKDRRRGGPTMPLGQGDVDFDAVFSALKRVGYRGPLVIEAYCGTDYLKDARRSVAFLREKLAALE